MILPDRDEIGRLAQELNCLGYFGFGGGYWVGKQAQVPKGTPSLCNELCPFSDTCWTFHKERIRRLWPALTKEREKMHGRGIRGLALTQRMREKFGGDPNQFVVEANANDGTRVASGSQPIERNPQTLSLVWPLRPITDVLESPSIVV